MGFIWERNILIFEGSLIFMPFNIIVIASVTATQERIPSFELASNIIDDKYLKPITVSKLI